MLLDEDPWMKQERKARELRAVELEQLRKENSEASRQWHLRFVSQWAILSGGTLTLLVTFAQTDHAASYRLFQIASVLLLISLLSAGLQAFFAGQSTALAARQLSGSTSGTGNTWARLYAWAPYISIVTYVLALILSWLFIDANLRA